MSCTQALTSAKDVLAAVTPGGKVVVMAVGAVELLILGGKGLVHQGVGAVTALKALLMPVLLLVRQVLKHTHARLHTSPANKALPGSTTYM